MKKRVARSNVKFNPVLSSDSAKKARLDSFASPKHPKSICVVKL